MGYLAEENRFLRQVCFTMKHRVFGILLNAYQRLRPPRSSIMTHKDFLFMVHI